MNLIAIAVLLWVSGPSRAELLYFARGGQVQGPATIERQSIRLETPAGAFTFERGDFAKVVPGHDPEREWPSREKAALSAGASARFEAAWWALENGLTSQAESMLRATVAADSAHHAAARMVAMLDRLSKPASDPDVDLFRRSLGEDAQYARGRHVLLLHQHSDGEAAERVEVLDRVFRTYYLIMSAHGVELRLPTARLPSVWFRRQADYRSFLRAEHAAAFLTTQGYYHPTLRAVFAFDTRDSPALKSARAGIAVREAEVGRTQDRVSQMAPNAKLRLAFPGEPARALSRPAADDLVERLRRDVDRERLLWELQWRATDLGTAAHELIHQLMAASGLPARHDDFPTWLHEGLAAQFEVIRGGRWAGVGRAHDLRLRDWRGMKSPARLLSVVRNEGFGHGYRRDSYASAWSLVYFLRKRHAQEFLTFLDLLRSPPADFGGADRPVAVFESVFGEALSPLESEWREFMTEVTTPLESERPASPRVEPTR